MTTEDEMGGWHHQVNGHEFEQAPGDVDGQGSWTCCSPWSHRVGHNLVTEQQQRCLILSKFVFSFTISISSVKHM